jgi:D-alanine-D-alanine ligase-like ATP-grasp enzyme
LAGADARHLEGCTRVDLIVDASGTPWTLEVNVSPGMTETSLVPMAAGASGMAFEELCDSIIRTALRDGAGEVRGPSRARDPVPIRRSR